MTRPADDLARPPWRTWVAARPDLAIAVLLAVAAAVAYGPVLGNGFVNLDDEAYVTHNLLVQGGLTWENVGWAFTAGEMANWHPLTWLSHMLDCELFGLWAGGHHLTSVLLHVASSILLYVVLRRMTGAMWRSAVVAALFALHPLHVESVAWASERKDVLSTLFWMLTMLAYVHYVRKPGVRRYAAVFVLLALGLMAKPMLVTLPLVLLLVDWWPLGRVAWGQAGGGGSPRVTVGRLMAEKVPLLALSAASSVVTYVVQDRFGAVASVLPLATRLTNVPISYLAYLGKTVWPAGLAVFYPFDAGRPGWQGMAAGLVLAGLTVLALAAAWRRPYAAAGWLWYLGTLVPVIGLVQVGSQAMADRYTYVPLIGIFVLAVWGAADLAGRWRRGPRVAGAAAAGALLACVILTRGQVRHWADSRRLFEHAVAVTRENAVAHLNLGAALIEARDYEGALAHLGEGLGMRILPYDADLHHNMSLALTALGRTDEAIAHCREALRRNPAMAEAHLTLGSLLAARKEDEEAMVHLRESLRLRPGLPVAHQNLGLLLSRRGERAQALQHFREAVRLSPEYAQAHFNLASALLREGQADEAIPHFREAIRLGLRLPLAPFELGNALAARGRIDEAMTAYAETLRLEPGHAGAYHQMGTVWQQRGHAAEAVRCFRAALDRSPDWPEAMNNLAWLLAASPDAAVRNGAEAVRLAEGACQRTARKEPNCLDTLAAAYAEAGRFADAAGTAQEAAALAVSLGAKDLAAQIEGRLRLYRDGKPYRDAATPPARPARG